MLCNYVADYHHDKADARINKTVLSNKNMFHRQPIETSCIKNKRFSFSYITEADVFLLKTDLTNLCSVRQNLTIKVTVDRLGFTRRFKVSKVTVYFVTWA